MPTSPARALAATPAPRSSPPPPGSRSTSATPTSSCSTSATAPSTTARTSPARASRGCRTSPSARATRPWGRSSRCRAPTRCARGSRRSGSPTARRSSSTTARTGSRQPRASVFTLDYAGLGDRTVLLDGGMPGWQRALRHRDGRPLVRVHGAPAGRGATVAFNVLDAAGSAVPYALVEQRARRAHVSVRGGCFCNPGAAEAAFGFPAEETARCLESTRRAGWSIPRFAACLGGRAVGAVRASLGVPSNEGDVRRLVEVVAGFAARSS